MAPELVERLAVHGSRPFILGICGAQGSGKSTLASSLEQMLVDQRVRCATLSLDDLYLSSERRRCLSEQVHPLLCVRGVPGTHDIALGGRVLDLLAQMGEVALPRFDKSSDEPLSVDKWPVVHAPLDILIFEGWCVGVRPQDASALGKPVNALEAEEDSDGFWRRYVNGRLATDYRAFFTRLDMLILLRAPSFDVVQGWRYQQEEDLRNRFRRDGLPTSGLMREEDITRFILYFQRITEHALQNGAKWSDMVIDLDERRNFEIASCK